MGEESQTLGGEGGVLGRMGRALVGCARFYQRRLSPIIAPRCRFMPTCSEYFIQAVTLKGALGGSVLGLWRLLRCNPWSRGGDDPVK